MTQNHKVLYKFNAMRHTSPTIRTHFMKQTVSFYENVREVLVQLKSESRLCCSCTGLGNWVLFAIYFTPLQQQEKLKLHIHHRNKSERLVA